MKNLFRAGLLAIALPIGSAGGALAGPSDMHLGGFFGSWCGVAARFDVQSKEPNLPVFYGRILILTSGQYDPMSLEQRGDYSLRITRYLSGPDDGKTQIVETHPPQEKAGADLVYALFQSRTTEGFGCKGLTSALNLMPY